jgi:hypothetical protein
MKNLFFKGMLTLIAGSFMFTSCSKDDEIIDQGTKLPTDILADNNWVDSTMISTETLWFKVTGAEAFNTLYVEWAEADYHGDSKNYSADINVSAYMLDGVTPYFEDVDNGYKEFIQEITLGSEKEVLVKVEINDASREGTFSLRATGVGAVEIEYITLAVADEWTLGTIADGEIMGYSVDCGDNQIVQVIWAEFDSPEAATEGYTADINGSVFYKDAATPYLQYGKTDNFLNKNNSHSDNPKAVEVDQTEKKIKIHIGVESLAGTFAIKVIPMPGK